MQELYRGADASVDKELENEIREAAETVISEILENTSLKKGDVFVIGCSSSEILGSKLEKDQALKLRELFLTQFIPSFVKREYIWRLNAVSISIEHWS